MTFSQDETLTRTFYLGSSQAYGQTEPSFLPLWTAATCGGI